MTDYSMYKYDHYSKLRYFLRTKDPFPQGVTHFINNNTYLFKHKGYGTPEMEMKFLHKIFLELQSMTKGLESISWEQCNNYNDNYYHIELTNFYLNEDVEIDSDITFLFDYYEEEEIKKRIYFSDDYDRKTHEKLFAKEQNIQDYDPHDGLDAEEYEAFHQYMENKFKDFELPCLKFLVILKLLELNFSLYYFLYVFGNGVKVKIDTDGITVTRLSDKEREGVDLGVGMYLDDL